MEVVAILFVIFALGGRSQDTAQKMLLISKMFLAIATIILSYVAILYFKFNLDSAAYSASNQIAANPDQPIRSSAANIMSFFQISRIEELYPWLIMLAICSASSLMMYLVSRYFDRKGDN